MDESWRAWTAQLVGARGPQPLASLERLFCESYVPLSNAIAWGLDNPPHARAAHDEFRKNFVRGYTDAFPTFAATTKRPRMVLDVHDIAARIGRLHGAQSTRLLLVDGMRGTSPASSNSGSGRSSVRAARSPTRSSSGAPWPRRRCVELETIARGVEALRAPAELDADVEPRARIAEYVRRLRVGPREIHKLDLVEARVAAARGQVLRALPDIAEATAEESSRGTRRRCHLTRSSSSSAITGSRSSTESGAALQGGASPEEVLVGGFAVLVGEPCTERRLRSGRPSGALEASHRAPHLVTPHDAPVRAPDDATRPIEDNGHWHGAHVSERARSAERPWIDDRHRKRDRQGLPVERDELAASGPSSATAR